MRILAITQRTTFRKLLERAMPDAQFVWSDKKLEALSKVITDTPDLVVIMLEDTFEAESLAIALSNQKLKALLLSPFPMSWWYRWRIKRQGCSYLQMPIAPEELRNRITRLLPH